MQAQVFFEHPIRAVQFTKKVVLVLDEAGGAHVYCAQRFKPLVSLQLGTATKRNLFLTSSPKGEHYVLVQNDDDSGAVQVFDINARKFMPKILAHNSPIRKVAVSPDGQYFATCSQKGTTVKVFAIASGAMLKKYRTSVKRSEIVDLSFSRRSEFLVSVSKTMRVQLFSVAKNCLVKATKGDDGSQGSTQASTRSTIATEQTGEQKGTWMAKLFSLEQAVKTVQLDMDGEKPHLVSFDEGNDTLIIVNADCQLSVMGGVLHL